jgi:hypothetical protein
MDERSRNVIENKGSDSKNLQNEAGMSLKKKGLAVESRNLTEKTDG